MVFLFIHYTYYIVVILTYMVLLNSYSKNNYILRILKPKWILNSGVLLFPFYQMVA